MTQNISHLNALLGRELGTNPYGEPIFMWAHSEDLYWPEFATGHMVDKPVMVPIIGGGEEVGSYIQVPEYRKEKMCPNLNCQWVMTVWQVAEQLTQWQAMFPGAPYPTRGHRIHTNASLPSYEGGPREPNLEETERFIKLLKFQRSHTHDEAMRGIDAERTAKDLATRKEIEDEIRDEFPAYMNLQPGKRGGWVSTPYTKKDIN
jgi:hypothetical protein